MPEIKIDLEFAHSLQLMLPEYDHVCITLVGCGGTGSWLAPAVARVARLLREQRGKEVRVQFMDPDRVERKNIYRQNFCAAEVRCNKAEALAERYGRAWGLEIAAIPQAFNPQLHRYTHTDVIIGCVDNAGGRRAIADCAKDSAINKAIVWLDCGNTRSYGQVLCGVKGVKNPFGIPGFCGELPMPHKQHPELLVDAPEEVLAEGSCAEIALQESQGLAINQRMAAEAADYLVRLLVTRDLRKFATYLNLESGTVMSRYITKKAVMEMLGKEG